MALRYLTAGESHGQGLVGIIEGLPANLPFSPEYLAKQMARRKLGFGRGYRQKIEDDGTDILSGVRHGQTIGSPIGLVLYNKDFRKWTDIMSVTPVEGEARRQVTVPRPGHTDLVGGIKYQQEDMRNILERSSARETAMKVALATFARKFLEELGIHIASRVVSIGSVVDESELQHDIKDLNDIVDESPVRAQDKKASEAMIELIEKPKKDKNTLGGISEVYATGLPIGLGSHIQLDKRLEGEIAHQFMGLNAMKGVEIGLGFETARVLGSEAHDEMVVADNPIGLKYETNRAGGITGGITTGQPLVVRAAMKPISTLMQPLKSVDSKTGEAAKAHVERADVCAVPAAAVIGESLLALTLADAVLQKFGGDSMEELKPRVDEWQAKNGY